MIDLTNDSDISSEGDINDLPLAERVRLIVKRKQADAAELSELPNINVAGPSTSKTISEYRTDTPDTIVNSEFSDDVIEVEQVENELNRPSSSTSLPDLTYPVDVVDVDAIDALEVENTDDAVTYTSVVAVDSVKIGNQNSESTESVSGKNEVELSRAEKKEIREKKKREKEAEKQKMVERRRIAKMTSNEMHKDHCLEFITTILHESLLQGIGGRKVYLLMLQQIPLSIEQARAIAGKYPTVRNLMDALLGSSSEIEGHSLLSSIVIRRGAGVLETERKLGLALGTKIYNYFTSL